ncbi:MAG: NDP-sugar synthase [Thermoanaerobaculia bacterium]|nr:NDP-sugar synthase [Thermoanaerobaculia bacterium]
MSATPFRAVVLAAGYGLRLRPLTEFLPKPLLPLAGMAVAAHTLSQLAAAGCEEVALNLHHLGEKIRSRLGGAYQGMRLTWSAEEQILGTLGALVRLRPFLAGTKTALVINGDSFCRWPIRRLLKRHRATGAAATLLLSTRAPVESFNPVGVDVKGRVVSFGGGRSYGEIGRRRVFAGAHCLDPARLDGLEEGRAELVTGLWEPLLRRGETLAAVESRRRWHDLGTPARYLAAARDVARHARGGRRRRPGGWIAPGGHADPSARLRRSVVERGARVEADAEVEGSLILDGARVTPGCRVHDSIVGFEVELPPGTAVEQRLVTAERADVEHGPTDSVLGGLVYTPIEG